MILFLQIIGVLLGSFILVFFENMFLVLFNFNLLFVLFLLFRRKINITILIPLTILISVIIDVVLHNRLGTTLLLLLLPSIFLYLLSFLSQVEEGLSLYISSFFAALLFYASKCLLTPFLLSHTWGFCNGEMLLGIVLKALITTALVWVGELIIAKFRDRGNNNQIRLK
ncbi:MAG TPA: hypothetical protein PLG47_00555 [Candidatus Dojkabacteria bacterium]|jgi:hypothetical protein|nr:hypothetical protein [Candidatus Dojkabacteria bacterium]